MRKRGCAGHPVKTEPVKWYAVGELILAAARANVRQVTLTSFRGGLSLQRKGGHLNELEQRENPLFVEHKKRHAERRGGGGKTEGNVSRPPQKLISRTSFRRDMKEEKEEGRRSIIVEDWVSGQLLTEGSVCNGQNNFGAQRNDVLSQWKLNKMMISSLCKCGNSAKS